MGKGARHVEHGIAAQEECERSGAPDPVAQQTSGDPQRTIAQSEGGEQSRSAGPIEATLKAELDDVYDGHPARAPIQEQHQAQPQHGRLDEHPE